MRGPRSCVAGYVLDGVACFVCRFFSAIGCVRGVDRFVERELRSCAAGCVFGRCCDACVACFLMSIQILMRVLLLVVIGDIVRFAMRCDARCGGSEGSPPTVVIWNIKGFSIIFVVYNALKRTIRSKIME